VVQEHLFGQGRALTQREQLKHLIFLAGQVDPLAVHVDRLGVQIDLQAACLDDGLGVALRAPHDRVDAGNELVLMEGLGHVVVGPEAQAPDLVLDPSQSGEDQDRGLYLADPQGFQDLVTAHIRKVYVEQNDVVVVDLTKIDAFFA